MKTFDHLSAVELDWKLQARQAAGARATARALAAQAEPLAPPPGNTGSNNQKWLSGSVGAASKGASVSLERVAA